MLGGTINKIKEKIKQAIFFRLKVTPPLHKNNLLPI